MKRKIITGIIIVIGFLLQSAIFPHLAFANIKPNIIVIIVSAIGFMRGRKAGMTVGFICGLLSDVLWGNVIGFYALILTMIGYLNGSFQRLFYDDELRLPIILISVSDFVYSIILYICLFMLQGRFHFQYYLLHVILPELVYTFLAALVLYQIIVWVNRRLESEEQRSASRFV